MYGSTPHSWLTLPKLARERVLCVDDDITVVLTVQRILAGRYDVSAIVGGTAALEAVRTAAAPFAAVVSDIRMPDLSGIALLQCIRQMAPATMRILLTAYPDRDSVAAAAEHCDVYRVLVKPCPPDLLLSTVEAAVRRHCELRAGASAGGASAGGQSASANWNGAHGE